ncbi:MAG: hypothetical protein V7606_1597 [Burkholderiales bacterium]
MSPVFHKTCFQLNALRTCLLLGGLLVFAHPAASAQQDAGIKTDRPDFVESSDVVGSRRFQVEAGYAVERNEADGRKERLSSTPLLLRAGISDTLELRLETDGRIISRVDRGVATDNARGYADMSVGIKWHAQDNDGVKPALGWLLHADLDTGSHAFRANGIRPSVRMVAEWELPHELSLGVMPGLMWDKRDDGRRFVSGILGVVLGKAWTERFGTFIELAAQQVAKTKNGGSIVTYDAGFTYLLSNSWQVDTGISRAANDNTPDYAWTVGVSRKF